MTATELYGQLVRLIPKPRPINAARIITRSQEQASDIDERYRTLKQEKETNFAQLKAKAELPNKRLAEQHAAEIIELKNRHAGEISKLKAAHQAEIAKLKEQHNKEIARLRRP